MDDTPDTPRSLPAASERRVTRILRRAKRELSARDVVNLATGKTWLALMIIGTAFVAAAGNWATSVKRDTQ